MNILNLFISGKGKSRTRIHHFAINMEKKDFFPLGQYNRFLNITRCLQLSENNIPLEVQVFYNHRQS